jgi:uncharacterized protein YndB with AHSA1/START domain
MMFTEQCLNKLELSFPDPHVQMEEYEHLGEIKTFNIDLHKRYQEITEQRRIMLDEKDADLILHVDFSTPPAVTWEWLQDPDKRNIWNGGHIHWSSGERPNGRGGVGASNHCAHGNAVSTEVTVDWHPFEYLTTESFENGKKNFSETLCLEALPNGGTRVHDRMVMHMPIPRFIRRVMVRYVLVTQHHYDKALEMAAQLAGEEFAKSRVE